jgi:hypothetical protein
MKYLAVVSNGPPKITWPARIFGSQVRHCAAVVQACEPCKLRSYPFDEWCEVKVLNVNV